MANLIFAVVIAHKPQNRITQPIARWGVTQRWPSHSNNIIHVSRLDHAELPVIQIIVSCLTDAICYPAYKNSLSQGIWKTKNRKTEEII
jgi:hypothetical protein